MLDSAHPAAKPRTYALPRRSSAYMTIMNVNDVTPNRVSTGGGYSTLTRAPVRGLKPSAPPSVDPALSMNGSAGSREGSFVAAVMGLSALPIRGDLG